MEFRRRQLVGVSKVIREIELEVECAARTDAKVLLTGESGVGKEVVAQLIHQESRRRSAPFVPINCAGVPDSLLESELFGHVRGSFTDAHRDKKGWLEQAQSGTVFMDEVGEMTARMQAVLLRFLESGEIQRVGSDRAQGVVDVRIVAATNRKLMAEVNDGKFRDDLYYRLNVIHIAIPPLRERMEDVPVLLRHFVQLASASHRVPVPEIENETINRLMNYAWPGNVRELKNVAERLVVRARGGMIPPSDLPEFLLSPAPVASAAPAVSPSQAVAAAMYERMTVEGESFWSVVYEPFMARDLTRDDLRAVVSRGLEQTRGSYKLLLELFNLGPADYKRLLGFLRKYQCHMPFQKFRSIPITPERVALSRQSRDEERLVNAG